MNTASERDTEVAGGISWEGDFNSLGVEIVYEGISILLSSITDAKPALQMRAQGSACARFTFVIPLPSLRFSKARGIAPLLPAQLRGAARAHHSSGCCGNANNTARRKAPACADGAEILRTTEQTNTTSGL